MDNVKIYAIFSQKTVIDNKRQLGYNQLLYVEFNRPIK